MPKKEYGDKPRIDFKALTPQIDIPAKAADRLYEKAFLAPAPETENEYAKNTTTWD